MHPIRDTGDTVIAALNRSPHRSIPRAAYAAAIAATYPSLACSPTPIIGPARSPWLSRLRGLGRLGR